MASDKFSRVGIGYGTHYYSDGKYLQLLNQKADAGTPMNREERRAYAQLQRKAEVKANRGRR